MIALLTLAVAGSGRSPDDAGASAHRVVNQYGVLPVPRAWAVAGATNLGGSFGVGASIGAGSTAVVFGEYGLRGPVTDGFFGVGTHSFIGDTYAHASSDGMMCRVIHRHYVRPGLLVGVVHADGVWGFRLRPEVSIGAFGNLLVAAPITRMNDGTWSAGAQIGFAAAMP